jgi:hypothetical protein
MKEGRKGEIEFEIDYSKGKVKAKGVGVRAMVCSLPPVPLPTLTPLILAANQGVQNGVRKES